MATLQGNDNMNLENILYNSSDLSTITSPDYSITTFKISEPYLAFFTADATWYEAVGKIPKLYLTDKPNYNILCKNISLDVFQDINLASPTWYMQSVVQFYTRQLINEGVYTYDAKSQQYNFRAALTIVPLSKCWIPKIQVK